MTKRTIVLIAIVLVTVVTFISAVASDTTTASPAVIGKDEPANIHVVAGVSRQDTLSYKGASYIAVKFESFHLPPGDKVVVRSPDNSIAYTYTNKGRADDGSFYATFIPGDTAVVEYMAQGSTNDLVGYGYSIPAFARGFTSRSPLSACGEGYELLPAKCYLANTTLGQTLPLAYGRAQAVARLRVRGIGLCTGWLVGSEGHVMTNHHCVGTRRDARLLDIEFSAESSSCEGWCSDTRGCQGKIVATNATLVTNSAEYDYALLKLPDSATVNVKQYGYLQLRGSGPIAGEQIYIPQHPGGYAKQIVSAVEGGVPTVIDHLNASTNCGKNRVAYKADTLGGSSGSPVIAARDNAVVALHNCGGCRIFNNGNRTNSGVDILDVIRDLQEKQITVKDLFVPGTAPLTPVPGTPRPPTPEPPYPAGDCVGLTSVECDATFFCTWNKLQQNCTRWWKYP